MLDAISMKIAKYHFNGMPIMKSLPSNDIKWILANTKEKRVKSNYELFREGSFPNRVFILKKGKVKIYQTTSDGIEQIVYIYEPGDIFGYRPILCNEKHPVSARTLEDSIVLLMPRARFQELLERSTKLAHQLLKNLSSEFSVWINYITTFAQYSVKERLALALLILSEKYKRAKHSSHHEIALSRKDLASFSGTSIETLSRTLGKWKAEKIIVTRGRKIQIRNIPKLLELID
ncbi:CarD family transcriptional regulator [Cytophagales bacterium WSM2-2]|nr:CarD family transcriptional regulator [Cytophagales bacterium WSM2-2]